MLDMEDIYCYLVSSLTRMEFSEACIREPEIRGQLHKTLEQAELMHCYLGFREKNRARAAQGLPSLKVEEEFSRHRAAMIHFLMKHDS